MAELDFQVRETRGCKIGQPTGEIDIDNAPILGDRLGALVEEGHTVLDLSLVTFLDSTALSAIIRAYRTGQAAGHHLRLAGAQGWVRRILQITELDAVLQHHDAVDEAIDALLAGVDSKRIS